MPTRRQNAENGNGKHVLLRPQLVRLVADLAAISSHAEGLGEPLLAAEANARIDHLEGSDFAIVVLGEAGVGKAMLVNALLGEQIIPVNYNDTGDDPASIDEVANAAGRTMVRVTASDKEWSYRSNRPWIARDNIISVFPLAADTVMTQACAAALDCADAVLLVVNAAAPQSAEFWVRLGNSLGGLPGNRLVIVANKLDFIDAGNQAARLRELSAHAEGAFGKVPDLLGLSARVAFESRQETSEPPAVGDLAPLTSSLASRLAARSDTSRLALNNDASTTLADRLLNIARSRLNSLDAERDRFTETLQQHQNSLNDAGAEIDQWCRDLDVRCHEAIKTIEQEKSNLANDLANKVNQLVQNVPLGWRYIEDAGYRNSELQKACLPVLLEDYSAATSRIRQKLFALISADIDKLNTLQKKWEQAAAARLLQQYAPVENIVDPEMNFNVENEIENSENIFEKSVKKFEIEFKNKCNVRSPRAFYLRFIRNFGYRLVGNDSKFQIACIRSLQNAVRQAVENSRFDAVCGRIFEKGLEFMEDKGKSLFEQASGAIVEHNQSLLHQYNMATTDVAHMQSQLESALHFCEAMKLRVTARADIVVEAAAASERQHDTAVFR